MEVINTIGRRKTSVARAYMSKGSGVITINNKPLDVYFPTDSQRAAVNAPFTVTETVGQFDVKVNVFGGGVSGQTGAISLAIARAIVKSDENLKSALRKEGLVTRDPRMVERKKPGQKKARKKFQFSKR